MKPGTTPSASPAGTGPAGEQTNILIVDDLPEKLLVFSTVLEDLAQNLVLVSSGKDALREVLNRDFAVILLDVNMPDLDGFETAELIRNYQRSAHTPIIFITSFADEMQTARGYSLGAVDYILSPVVPEVLRSKVRVFVALHAMQRQIRRQADDRAAMMAAQAAREAAEENDRRSAFLSHASRVLGGSLDLAIGAGQLAALVVPRITRLALVALIAESNTLESVLVATATPTGTEPELQTVECSALPVDVQALLHRASSATRHITMAVSETSPAFGVAAGPPVRSVTAIPLTAGEHVVGTLLAVDVVGPELQLLDDLAGRAAIAFENARLYRSLQSEIVERSAAEAELQLANRRKDEFLAMLSHELRNPLAAVCAALEMIRRLQPAEAKVVWASEVMDRQLRQMTRLVDELLDVARISQNKIVLARESVDLNAVIAQSVETAQVFFDARQQTLAVSLPAEPVWLQGDAARLAQIVSNLLHNASKYSGTGTLTELSCKVDEHGALVCVRDRGIGIDADLLPRIFDLFAQGARGLDRAQGGLGVGLTLAMRLAQLHGGHIEASSEGAGRGSEFRLRLPCLWLAHGDSTAQARNEPAPRQVSRRVLVVDDNRDAAQSIAALLQLAGHQVRTAGDGVEALGIASEFVPEVVILDIGLPLLNGYEVARRMRQQLALQQTLLLALTGYGQVEDRTAALAAGFDHHFVKPADPGALAACIAEWNSGGRTGQSGSPGFQRGV